MKLSRFFKTHKWCQDAYARTINNHACSPHNPRAVSWCVVGAAEKLHIRIDTHWTVINDNAKSKQDIIDKLKQCWL